MSGSNTDHSTNGLTLVLGGARSGKSLYAEQCFSRYPKRAYLATAEAVDGDFSRRIAAHLARRGPEWTTHLAPIHLPETLRSVTEPFLADCLSVWLANLLHHEPKRVGDFIDALIDALESRTAFGVLVSVEAGLGLLPENRLAREFLDHLGDMNQRLAKIADSVVFVAAGLPLVLK